jgi:hypothetical protein
MSGVASARVVNWSALWLTKTLRPTGRNTINVIEVMRIAVLIR